MKKLFVLFVLMALTAGLSVAQQKYALVIGNGAYTGNWNKLENPVNDAVDMEAALKSLGFQVELVRNGNRNQMQTAVINFCRKLNASRNAYGFFYYAGHGAQDRNGMNYLIPVNANTQSLNQLADEALSVRFVLSELEEAGNELNMVVLDACRNVPRGLDRGSRGLAVESNAPRGSIIMYATAAGKTADDGAGRNGLFTGHLLKNLKTPGLSVTEVFMRTGSDVARATNGDQYPETQYKYFETAYLGQRPTPNTPVQPAPAPTPAPVVQPVAPPIQPAPNNMVRIQGGTFTMGSSPTSDPERFDYEVQHQVTVGSFYMGKYEVTQKEYQEIMGTNPSNFKGDNLPVEQVSWYDAIEYCNKRSQKEGLTPAYTINKNQKDPNNKNDEDKLRWTVTWNKNANGYRLPTEAEWEYACRAGTTTPFSTGNIITTSQANYNGNLPYYNNPEGEYRQKTTPVGSFAPNGWGLYDMHGNVWEWCWDWMEGYASGSQTDPAGASSGTFRVYRGGSWITMGRSLRSAHRYSGFPSDRENFLGFRVVRPL
jgi:formylglycine-generating enzyme required for sulfatase activity